MRARFFSNWSNVGSFASLLAGSFVVVSVLSSVSDTLMLAAGSVVAISQAAEHVFRLASKATAHVGFARDFMALERIMAMHHELTDDDIRKIWSEILTIESREPPVKRYLDLICHNQVAVSIGSNDIERLTWWQRSLSQYLNGDTALQCR